MCGIVGLFLKTPSLQPQLGLHFAPMLVGMSERGPDSTGFAVYHHPIADDRCKLTLYNADAAFPWGEVGTQLGRALDAEVDVLIKGCHAILTVDAEADRVRAWAGEHHPEIRIMGYGRVMEVYKEKGLTADVVEKYGVAEMEGSHAVGHTRMATESAVTTIHSHPFTAAADTCLVHNGSLSNYNRLRQWLRRQGMTFETDNDTEVAARYFAYRLGQGASLAEAMEAGLRDLDGFYTFTMGTEDGFAVLRDGIACKPAVLAETDHWVAMASEYRSLAHLPGVETASIWEPKPGVVYTWAVKKAA
ncbi:MAG: glutamine amidotransferase [Rhodospirillales bacterium]|jgi:amidophosphoribosyltransferase|nr:glutamine amidotransferase [Rhodospirillales bacterium]